MTDNDLELELKRLIVRTLNLEDLRPEEIASEEPLFVEGLGLDSIDALEIGVAIGRTYGIKMEASDKSMKRHFANVRSLAELVTARRGGAKA
jgi:acyl carrier protein